MLLQVSDNTLQQVEKYLGVVFASDRRWTEEIDTQTEVKLTQFCLSFITLWPHVEFALHPQHETSCDSEIQIKEDLKRKFRKQLGSLALIPLNSRDKEEALECQC